MTWANETFLTSLEHEIDKHRAFFQKNDLDDF